MSLLEQTEAAAGLAVYGANEVPGAAAARGALAEAGVPGLLMAKDPTLWGPDAEAEAAIRLGWVDTFRHSRELLPRLAELRAELADLTHVVLAGMGGSSLAPEVIARTLGKARMPARDSRTWPGAAVAPPGPALTVLDTTDPGQVREAIHGGGRDRLLRTLVVVSSKSGSTVETDSHRRVFWQAFLDAGLSAVEAGRHFVIVTDPGSPLADIGAGMGAAVFLADPNVGGRYSALTAFGLVPCAFAGVDVVELLDQAAALAGALDGTKDNPGLALGAALGAATGDGRDKLVLADDGTGITGLGDWAEQLVAESTGKQGRGILPVVVESPTAPGTDGTDVLLVSLGGSLPPGAVPGGGAVPHLAVNGPLGAQFLTWEYAVAIAGRMLGIDPFDQPNVTESKDNTKRILATGLPAAIPSFVEGPIEVYGGQGTSLTEVLRNLLAGIAPDGYLAVMAYLDRHVDAAAVGLRPALAAHANGRPVTFGWGPRFLHSTGQYHKGGPQVGSFLQITGSATEDLPVPDVGYTFGTLQAAQAAGDREALAGRGRPLLRLHLADRPAGIAALLVALGGLSG